jgi:hypothetical protein
MHRTDGPTNEIICTGKMGKDHLLLRNCVQLLHASTSLLTAIERNTIFVSIKINCQHAINNLVNLS